MADGPKAVALGPGQIKLGKSPEQDLSCQVTNATVTWDVSEGDSVPVLCGGALIDEDDINAKFEAELIQDYQEENGVLKYTWANMGSEQPLEFRPNTGKKCVVVGNVVISPMDLGGDVKKKNTSKVSWRFTAPPKITYTSA